jgi:exodeoxyribonuclease V alpha subunit
MYTLSELSNEGHVYAEKQQHIAKAETLLEASAESVIMTMDDMIQKEELIIEKQIIRSDGEGKSIIAVYLPPFYYAEVGVANKLKKLNSSPAADKLYKSLTAARKKSGNEALSVDIEAIQKKTGMEYDDIQADAIRQAAMAKVMVLTGGPGTGKTTTTHGIISAYKAYGLKILLAAPTGRAAKRMTEATGMESKTIHRLLETKPGRGSALMRTQVTRNPPAQSAGPSLRRIPEGYQRNEDNPLEGDVLIVDECSMIDIILMNSLLKAIPPTMRLIMVGDINQLPSVGAGNVLGVECDSHEAEYAFEGASAE